MAKMVKDAPEWATEVLGRKVHHGMQFDAMDGVVSGLRCPKCGDQLEFEDGSATCCDAAWGLSIVRMRVVDLNREQR